LSTSELTQHIIICTNGESGFIAIFFTRPWKRVFGKAEGLPVAVMLFGLIFRGVAFDFRAKVPFQQKWRWNKKFFYGSLLTSLAQGYMLGSYIIGFNTSLSGIMFSCLIAVLLASAYCLVGACWLIMKCEGVLQEKAVKWAQYHLMSSVIGLVSISLATPLISERIYDKWFNFPALLWLSPIPIMAAVLVAWLYMLLRRMPLAGDRLNWLPLVITIGIYIFSFCGLAYSFFPYIVPEEITIVEAAASPDSLKIMLVGALIVLPVLLSYTALSYYIFRGKVSELRYD